MIGDNDIVLESTLETWREILEDSGFKISRGTTEYLHLPFEDKDNDLDTLELKIMLQREELSKCERFKYLGSVIRLISKDGNRKSDLDNRVQIGWCRRGDLCDRKLPLKLKGKIYKS